MPTHDGSQSPNSKMTVTKYSPDISVKVHNIKQSPELHAPVLLMSDTKIFLSKHIEKQ